MKKFYLLLVVAMMAVSTNLMAQEAVQTITLKSGLALQGTIVEEVPGVSITIRTLEGDTFIYRADEVKKVDYAGKTEGVKDSGYRQTGKFNTKRTCYRGFIELGAGANISGGYWDLYKQGVEGEPGLTGLLKMSHGVQCTQHFYIGVGLGVLYSKHDLFQGNTSISQRLGIPITLNLRSNFIKNRRLSPYLDINIGYSLGIGNKPITTTGYDWDGSTQQYKFDFDPYSPTGIYFDAGLGLAIFHNAKNSINLGVSCVVLSNKYYTGMALQGRISYAF